MEDHQPVDLKEELRTMLHAARAAANRNKLPDIDDELELEHAPRLSGGQPRNQNARKHGFYAKYATPEEEQELLEAMDLNDFAPEVAVLRVRLRNLLNNPDAKPEHITNAVNCLCRVMGVQRRYIFR